jgi:hypothetical protein
MQAVVWIGAGVAFFLIVQWLRFSNRSRLSVQDAVDNIQVLTIMLPARIKDHLSDLGVGASPRAVNEGLAFQFAILGWAIQEGGGTHMARQFSCSLLQSRLARQMTSIEMSERHRILQERYLEYGSKFRSSGDPRQNIARAMAAFHYVAAEGPARFGGAMDGDEIQFFKDVTECFIVAREAWRDATHKHRLFKDRARMVEEFEDYS